MDGTNQKTSRSTANRPGALGDATPTLPRPMSIRQVVEVGKVHCTVHYLPNLRRYLIVQTAPRVTSPAQHDLEGAQEVDLERDLFTFTSPAVCSFPPRS